MSKQPKKESLMQKAARLQSQKKKSKVGFFAGMKEEMKKVTWTSKKELALCTKIVLGTIVVLGFGIYVIDLSLQGTLQGLSKFVHWITT